MNVVIFRIVAFFCFLTVNYSTSVLWLCVYISICIFLVWICNEKINLIHCIDFNHNAVYICFVNVQANQKLNIFFRSNLLFAWLVEHSMITFVIEINKTYKIKSIFQYITPKAIQIFVTFYTQDIVQLWNIIPERKEEENTITLNDCYALFYDSEWLPCPLPERQWMTVMPPFPNDSEWL